MSQIMQVAIIDDEADIRDSISQWLGLSGFETMAFASAAEALLAITADFPGVVISDIKMPGMDGIALLKRFAAIDSTLPVIMITGHGDVPLAVEAMRLGAFDFLEKPFRPDVMSDLAARACKARRLALEGRALRRELSEGAQMFERLIGHAPEMAQLREDILDYSQADGHVLIQGETGTGKTLTAHALHAVSSRASKRFVTIFCAAWTGDDLTAQLFGPTRNGAPSLVEEARGGTLCVEDIEALPPQAQARLLEMIDSIDSAQTRIIAICNNQNAEEPLEKVLRADLLYKLGTMRITCPPLRHRGQDILTLFSHMCHRYSQEYGSPPPTLTAEETAQILMAPWPGNLRQLISLAERTILQNRRVEGEIAGLLLAENDKHAPMLTFASKPLKEHVDSFEKLLIEQAMRRHRGNITAVLQELSLPRRTLNEKMTKYGLQRTDFTAG